MTIGRLGSCIMEREKERELLRETRKPVIFQWEIASVSDTRAARDSTSLLFLPLSFLFFSHSHDHCVPLDYCILFSFFPRFFFSSSCIFASHERERPINFFILVRDPRGHYIQPNNTHINQHCFLSLASLRATLDPLLPPSFSRAAFSILFYCRCRVAVWHVPECHYFDYTRASPGDKWTRVGLISRRCWISGIICI